MKPTQFVARAGAVLALLSPAAASAHPVCSPVVINSTCTITINRDEPASPMTMRMRRGATATVTVEKRPLDNVLLEITTTDVGLPDPVASILNAFMPTLGKVTIGSRILGTPGPLEFTVENARPTGSVLYDDLIQKLLLINQRQLAARELLGLAKRDVDAGARELRAAQEMPIKEWRRQGFVTVRDRVLTALDKGVAAQHPGGVVSLLRIALEDVSRAVASIQVSPNPQTPDAQRLSDNVKELLEIIRAVGFNQALLESGVKSIEASQAALDAAAVALRRLDPSTVYDFSRDFTQNVDEVGRNVAVKITAQDIVSKTTTNLATVTMLWSETRWELSAGVMFSWLENRSFQNASIVDNGQPRLEQGRVLTVVTETTSWPAAVPVALAHFRLGETAVGGRRLAALLSGGVGVNLASGSADLAAGMSIAYRSLVLSVLAHGGRDIRLLNGVEVGDELGVSPPTLATERFWTVKPSIGIGIRVPF